jgi:hypothetical protein
MSEMMTSTNETTADEIVGRYFDMWRTTDPADRQQLVEQVFTTDGRHVDPNADAQGHDELAAMITAVHEGFAGFGIARTSGIDQHGDQLRFSWEMVGADGSVMLAGIDVAEIAPDGRLVRVAGFWGDLPEQ